MKEGGTGLHKTIREINLVYKGLSIVKYFMSSLRQRGMQLSLFALVRVRFC